MYDSMASHGSNERQSPRFTFCNDEPEGPQGPAGSLYMPAVFLAAGPPRGPWYGWMGQGAPPIPAGARLGKTIETVRPGQ